MMKEQKLISKMEKKLKKEENKQRNNNISDSSD